jgi:hypothetical protein
MFSPLPKSALTTAVALAMVAAPCAAFAASEAPAGQCAAGTRIVVEELGEPAFLAIAPKAGKYNPGRKSSPLLYSSPTTRERSTAWVGGEGADVSFGIAQIEAHTDYIVTERVSRGIKIIADMDVPSKRYGYLTPAAEVRTFWITERFYTRDCVDQVGKDFGVLKAITAVPYFKECISTTPDCP